MQFVVVDIGPDARAEQLAWVLEACTSAVRDGSCVAEAPADGSPRAVAIVRVRDTAGRIVRIEVGRRREERAHWSVREIEFASGDPDEERWRSVGLALATLVGEIEEDDAAPEPAAAVDERNEPGTAESNSSPPAAGATDTSSSPPAADRTLGVDTEPDAATADSDEPLPRPRAFLGVGGLAGRGSATHPLRWGGGVRAAWVFDSGLQLGVSGDYSALDYQAGLDLDWVKLASGVGYRHFVSDRWSFGLMLRAGVRGLGTTAEQDAEQFSRREWSFMMLGSADAWWQVARLGGVWLEFELASIGRTTRLLDAEGRVQAEVPLGDAAAVLGIWLSL